MDKSIAYILLYLIVVLRKQNFHTFSLFPITYHIKIAPFITRKNALSRVLKLHGSTLVFNFWGLPYPFTQELRQEPTVISTLQLGSGVH